MADAPIPLATAAQMQEGAFADLVRSFSAQTVSDLMVEATRECEGIVGRRLAPFTVTESHRADGIDPDEYSDASNLPLDLQGTLGRSYAYALGASTLVRHMWLNEYAARYPDLWTYSNLQISIVRSYGGSQPVSAGQLLGTYPDTGHVFFTIGLFLPIGSMISATYSGGYTVATPADLVRACKYMAASIAVTELDPLAHPNHDPDLLRLKAEETLAPYMRS